MGRREILVLGALTLAGFCLRAAAMGESLFGDEIYTLEIAAASDLGDVMDGVRETENTPPLFYLLAWITRRIGDPTVWVRLPSLVLGTALVPLAYALAFRVGRRTAGLFAAALVSFSAFAVFFSVEARAYTAAAFFVSLSTLALLLALDRPGRRGAWAVFVLAGAAAVYTHYTCAIPLAAQAAWALLAHRDRLRQVLIAHGAIALAYVPWLPQLRTNGSLEGIDQSFPFGLETALRAPLHVLPGSPLQGLADLPGRIGVVVFGLGAALLVAGAARGHLRGIQRPPELVLLVVLAAATPAGLLLYSAFAEASLYAPRNLITALPPVACLAGVLLSGLEPRLARVAAAALLLAGVAAGGLQTLGSDHRRPGVREAAAVIDARARPGDHVVDVPVVPGGAAGRATRAHFDRDHDLYGVVGAARDGGLTLARADPRAWRGALPGSRVFVVGFGDERTFLLPRPPQGGRAFRLVGRQTFEGRVPVALLTYEAR